MTAFHEVPSRRNAGMGESVNNIQSRNTAHTGQSPLKPTVRLSKEASIWPLI